MTNRRRWRAPTRRTAGRTSLCSIARGGSSIAASSTAAGPGTGLRSRARICARRSRRCCAAGRCRRSRRRASAAASNGKPAGNPTGRDSPIRTGSIWNSPVRHLLDEAARRARRYLAALDARAVAPSPQALAALARFDGPLPEQTSSPMEVLAELDEFGSPATMASAGGRFFGFVIGGSLPVTVAASWLAGAWDQNGGVGVTSPINARLEGGALGWGKGVFPLPPGSGGGFVAPGTAPHLRGAPGARARPLGARRRDLPARTGTGCLGAC